MSGKAAKVWLTEKQQNILQQIMRSTTAPNRLVQRVDAILLAFAGTLNVAIANEIGLARNWSASTVPDTYPQSERR